jgi:hypothetical protein
LQYAISWRSLRTPGLPGGIYIPGFAGEIIIAENHQFDDDNSRGLTTDMRNEKIKKGNNPTSEKSVYAPSSEVVRLRAPSILKNELEQQFLLRTLKVGKTNLIVVEVTAAVHWDLQMIDQGRLFFRNEGEGRCILVRNWSGE